MQESPSEELKYELKLQLEEFMTLIKNETKNNTLETLIKTMVETLGDEGYFKFSEEFLETKESIQPKTPKLTRKKKFKKVTPLVDEKNKIHCDHCKKTFLARKSYLAHMRNFHPDEKADPRKRDPVATCEMISKNFAPQKCGAKMPISYFYKHFQDQHDVKRPSLLHHFRYVIKY